MASSNRRPGRKSLLNEMQRLVLPSTFSVGHEFLPRGALFSLVTPENIKLVLGNPSDALVEFICGEPHVPSEKTHARKIFAILLYIDLEASIESFERHQFTDEMLPIKAETIDDNCNPEFERDCQHSDALNVFHNLPWTEDNIRSFHHKQWKFLAPVFSKENNSHFLHDNRPLPFTWMGSQYVGNSRYVREVKIHEDHQEILPLVRLTWLSGH